MLTVDSMVTNGLFRSTHRPATHMVKLHCIQLELHAHTGSNGTVL